MSAIQLDLAYKLLPESMNKCGKRKKRKRMTKYEVSKKDRKLKKYTF